jgi:hypothetical protein
MDRTSWTHAGLDVTVNVPHHGSTLDRLIPTRTEDRIGARWGARPLGGIPSRHVLVDGMRMRRSRVAGRRPARDHPRGSVSAWIR